GRSRCPRPDRPSTCGSALPCSADSPAAEGRRPMPALRTAPTERPPEPVSSCRNSSLVKLPRRELPCSRHARIPHECAAGIENLRHTAGGPAALPARQARTVRPALAYIQCQSWCDLCHSRFDLYGMRWSMIRLIWFRELRDQLRDRRTVFMIAV